MGKQSVKSRRASRLCKIGMMTTAIWALASPPASALDCETGSCLPPVEVWGMRLWDQDLFFNLQTFQSLSQVAPGYNPFRLRMSWDDYFIYQEMVARSRTELIMMADVRCNPLATNYTNSTTSESDAATRFQAAQQLFVAMYAANGAWGLRATIGANAPVWYAGSMRPTFVLTLADGKQEAHAVNFSISPTLIFDSAPSIPQGIGVQPRPC